LIGLSNKMRFDAKAMELDNEKIEIVSTLSALNIIILYINLPIFLTL